MHSARLKDGREVVVKVVRPGIEVIIRRDVGLLYLVAELAERYWREGRRLHPRQVVAEYEVTILDELAQSEDWVELYNGASTGINISNFGLSDDVNEPGKWRFPPGTVVPPKSYMIVWLDNDVLDGPLHATFKLDGSGEELLLSGPANTGNVTIDQVRFGPQKIDRSLGRIPNGRGPFRPNPIPTPAARNTLEGSLYR